MKEAKNQKPVNRFCAEEKPKTEFQKPNRLFPTLVADFIFF